MADQSDDQATSTRSREHRQHDGGEPEKWLRTDESKEVVQKSGNGESTGHASGRRIIELLKAKKSDLGDDYVHIRKVVGYAHRHLAQRPNGDISESAWRPSLMN